MGRAVSLVSIRNAVLARDDRYTHHPTAIPIYHELDSGTICLYEVAYSGVSDGVTQDIYVGARLPKESRVIFVIRFSTSNSIFTGVKEDKASVTDLLACSKTLIKVEL